ncbi:MAG: lamin tail domain-containing protein [Microgenomates group bacterium]|jgi:hypothetical protein
MIKNLLLKISVMVFVFSFSFVGVTYGRVNPAGFNDFEESAGNNLQASTLDFSLRNSDGSLITPPLFNVSSFKPEDSSSKSAVIKKDGTLDFNYNISAAKIGDDNLCSALQIEAKLDGVTKYSGNLLGLNTTPAITITGDQDDWTFRVTLVNSDASLQDKTCNFNIAYRGWQTDSDGTWGFSDEEILSNNVSTGNWGAISAGDVIINEVMWMGSTESTADEWLELRNMTNHEIDIGKWTLDNTKDGGARKLMIPASRSIPANGYFLIANYPKTSANSVLNVDVDEVANLELLNSENGNIILKDKNGNIIDQAKGDSWPVGENGTDKKSMERNNTPGDGTQISNWHLCINSFCNDTTYWDSEGRNYGTPKAVNLSENDPTSPDYIPSLAPPIEVSSSAILNISPTPESSGSASIVPTPSETPTPTPVSEPSPTPTAVIIPESTPAPTETQIPTP